jgi:hypothetical protein
MTKKVNNSGTNPGINEGIPITQLYGFLKKKSKVDRSDSGGRVMILNEPLI